MTPGIRELMKETGSLQTVPTVITVGLYFVVNQKRIRVKNRIAALFVLSLCIAACDRLGSEAWCEKQKQTPKS